MSARAASPRGPPRDSIGKALIMDKLTISRRALLGAAGAGLLPRSAQAAPITLDGLKQSGELRIGCEAAYVPFTYRDTSGQIIGYDVELVAAFLKPVGVKANF